MRVSPVCIVDLVWVGEGTNGAVGAESKAGMPLRFNGMRDVQGIFGIGDPLRGGMRD